MTDDQETRITLRMPTALRDRLAASAETTSRSMNGEIVSRLEESFDPEIAQLVGDRSFYLGAIQTAVAMALDEFREDLIREVREVIARKGQE